MPGSPTIPGDRFQLGAMQRRIDLGRLLRVDLVQALGNALRRATLQEFGDSGRIQAAPGNFEAPGGGFSGTEQVVGEGDRGFHGSSITRVIPMYGFCLDMS